jgi:hypothetical protein
MQRSLLAELWNSTCHVLTINGIGSPISEALVLSNLDSFHMTELETDFGLSQPTTGPAMIAQELTHQWLTQECQYWPEVHECTADPQNPYGPIIPVRPGCHLTILCQGNRILYEDKFKLAMLEATMEVIADPSIPKIKQCEMFNKWRPLIPASFQDKLCPKPLQSILEEQKTIKKEKQKLYVSKKKKAKNDKMKYIKSIIIVVMCCLCIVTVLLSLLVHYIVTENRAKILERVYLGTGFRQKGRLSS